MKVQIKQTEGLEPTGVVSHAEVPCIAELLEREFCDCPLFSLPYDKALIIADLHVRYDLLTKSVREVRSLFEKYGLARSLRADHAIFAFQIALFSLKYNFGGNTCVPSADHWINLLWARARARTGLGFVVTSGNNVSHPYHPDFWDNREVSPWVFGMIRHTIFVMDLVPANKFEQFVRLHGLRYMRRKLLAYYKYAQEYFPVPRGLASTISSEECAYAIPFLCLYLADYIKPVVDELGMFTPLIVELNGPAGVGKTTFARFLAHVIGSKLPYLAKADYLYSRANDKFWNGYEHQPVVLYDDPNQGRIQYDLGFELIALGGGVFARPPMAFEKDMDFCSFVVIVTTNRRLCKSRLRVDPRALRRRIVTLTFSPYSSQSKFEICDEYWTQFFNSRPLALPKFALLCSIFEGNLETVLQKYSTVVVGQPRSVDETSSVREFRSRPVPASGTASEPLLVSEADPVSPRTDCGSNHTAYSRKQVVDREGNADLSAAPKPVISHHSGESKTTLEALDLFYKRLRRRLVLSTERLDRDEQRKLLIRLLTVLRGEPGKTEL